jgi:tetratricopeptide (TPR) repeat protein
VKSSISIQHLPFFEKLGATEENSSAWRRCRAVLVTLRMVDTWMQERAGPDPWNFLAVRRAIDALDATDPAAALLRGIVDVVAAKKFEGSSALARLLALGRIFELDAEWPLAIDIYESVERNAQPAEDGELAADALMRIGFCARTEGQWDRAMDAYLRAGRLAEILGDRTRSLRTQLAHATITRQRGNWKEAASLIDRAIEASAASGVTSVQALALHERAILAFQQKEFERGIEYAHESIRLQDTQTKRDRVMIDMASGFLELGLRSAARDAYLIVSVTAQEQWSRWLASINLMELASVEACEPLFQQYRRDLGSAPLPTPLRAGFLLTAGRGLHMLGHSEEGTALLREAVELSASAGINDILFQAEEALASPPERLTPAPEPVQASTAVGEIARSLRREREEAGV